MIITPTLPVQFMPGECIIPSVLICPISLISETMVSDAIICYIYIYICGVEGRNPANSTKDVILVFR